MLALEEHGRRAERVEAEECAGRQERERDQQDARVAAAVGGLPRGVRQNEEAGADAEEEHEVDLVVAPVRVQLLAQDQRDEADERQQAGRDPRGDRQQLAALLGRSQGLPPQRHVHWHCAHGRECTSRR